jgi:hypothetical protein
MKKIVIKKNIIKISLLVFGLLGLSLFLAWTASGFYNVEYFPAFLGFSLLASAIIGLGWFLVSRKEVLPGWLLALIIGAALLRLGMGVIWYTILPHAGYNSPSENKGYVMSDAHKRDRAAWELSQSGQSLLDAYGKYRKADQYGGLLFLSASLYRGIGGSGHTPLGMVEITAAFSALVVLFAWAFVKEAWSQDPRNDQIARLAALGLAIYPEAVLLGSSQMREAFLITLVMSAFYGLAVYRRQRTWVGPAWILGSLVLTLFFSPPIAGLTLVCLLAVGLIWGGFIQSDYKHKRWFWIALALTALVILIGSYFALERLTQRDFNNPLELLNWWFQRSAEFQAHLTKRSSGWVQRIFRSTPEWSHTPLLLAYGSVQPFLPAALGDLSGVLIWRLISIVRAVGWTLLWPLLLYAPIRAFSRNKGLKPEPGELLARALSLVVWSVILIAAFRAGADLWDNVRYRATFAGLQIILATWAWVSYRTAPDPWLRRALILVLSVLAWFMPWYIGRYTEFEWLVFDPFVTLGLGIVTGLLIISAEAIRQRKTRKKK